MEYWDQEQMMVSFYIVIHAIHIKRDSSPLNPIFQHSIPPKANKGWNLGEVTDYCTADFSAAYTTSFFVVMNKDKWNSLSANNRKIIEQVNKEWVIKHGEAWDASDAEGIVFFLNQGGQIIGLDANEAERWKMAVAPIIEEYVKKTNGMGLPGGAIVDFTVNTLSSLQ